MMALEADKKLTVKALNMGVAAPAFGASTDWPVTTCFTDGSHTTGVRHFAGVKALVINACQPIAWTISVMVTFSTFYYKKKMSPLF